MVITTQSDSQRQFCQLLDQHKGIVVKVASIYCWHPDDNEELIQEISAQLWRTYASYNPENRFSTWMYRVALNVSISWLRKKTSRESLIIPLDEQTSELVDSELDFMKDERVESLRRIINTLAPMERALMLLYLDDLSYHEIAEVLGISETNVATKISRLKKQLSKLSAQEAGE